MKIKKNILDVKVKKIPIVDWEEMIVVLNEIDAVEYGLNAYDKVKIRSYLSFWRCFW